MARPARPLKPAKPRGRGRPPGGDTAVRAALLEHARRLFLQHGFADVGTRRIATAAGTTPAMIRYYFTDKLGLYRAMIEEAMRPVLAELRAVADRAAAPDVETVMRYVHEDAGRQPMAAIPDRARGARRRRSVARAVHRTLRRRISPRCSSQC